MRRSNVIGLIGVILGIAVIVSIFSWFLVRETPTLLQGVADATSYKASSKVAGRIEQMLVKEGEYVRKGQLLYILSIPEVEAKVQQARAAEMAAAAQQSKAQTGARPQEIEAARSLLAQAQAAQTLATRTYERAKNLYDLGVIPAQQFDEATAALRQANAAVDAAGSQYSIALEGARSEDLSAARAATLGAAAVVSEATSLASDAYVYSPVDGQISSIIAEEGELIGQGYPVVTILDLNDMYVSYNIKETLMPGIVEGARFVGYVPALDRDLEFYVDYISPQADFATWSATRTQGGFDIRTFNVKTRPVADEGRLRPGMSVIVNGHDIDGEFPVRKN